MYIISKEFHFSASHQLKNLPPDHPCVRLHGHNYKVSIELQSSTLDDAGMVVDYNQLKPFRDYIDDHLDHRHLNDVMDGPTTAENLAHHLFLVAVKLDFPGSYSITAVRVSETEKTWAEYRP